MSEAELVEALASAEHAGWARYMQYFLGNCEPRSGGLFINGAYVAALRRQIETHYEALGEQEQQYDRDEVAHILPAIRAYAIPEQVG